MLVREKNVGRHDITIHSTFKAYVDGETMPGLVDESDDPEKLLEMYVDYYQKLEDERQKIVKNAPEWTPGEPMTEDHFEGFGFHFLWDMRENNILNLDAPKGVPDGVYNVTYDYCGAKATKNGLAIKDGKFDIVPTVQAIIEVVENVHGKNPNHIFIEALEWTGHGFEVHMGS